MCMKSVIVILRRGLRQGWRALVLGACATLVIATSAAAEVPAAVVSINPIHSLVAAVLGGAGVPVATVGGGVLLHEYALRPEASLLMSPAGLAFLLGAILWSTLN